MKLRCGSSDPVVREYGDEKTVWSWSLLGIDALYSVVNTALHMFLPKLPCDILSITSIPEGH